MTTIHDKTSIIAALDTIYPQTIDHVRAMTDEQFNAGSSTSWSAAGYLKHIIIVMKMFNSALRLPHEELRVRYGQSEKPSASYDDLIAVYETYIYDGWQAPEMLVPVAYRMPESIPDEKAYLIEAWTKINQEVIARLATWSEDDLDLYRVPHAAMQTLSIREMLFFMIHHNHVHTQDIARIAQSAQSAQSAQ